MKKIIVLILITLLSAGYSQTADEVLEWAQYNNGFGIRAAGMGNAYTAAATDYSAIYWNPAGLAALKKSKFSAGLYHNNYQNNGQYAGTANNQTQAFTKLQNVGMAYPFPVYQGSFVVAFGYQVVHNFDDFTNLQGFSRNSNDLYFDYGNNNLVYFDRSVQQQFTLQNTGGLNQWSMAAAIALSPRFNAGVTLNFYSGQKDYSYDYRQDDINNVYTLNSGAGVDFDYYAYHQRIKSDFSGFEAKLGGMFELSPNLQLGTTITFPTALTIDESWSENDELAYDDLSVPIDAYDLGSGTFDYIVKIPFKFETGLAFHSDFVTISGSAKYVDWSQLEFKMPDNRDITDYESLLAENKFTRENYRGVLSYAVGGEIKPLGGRLMLRGGYRVEPSAYRFDNKENDRIYYSGGIGYQVDRNTVLNASYTTGSWKKRNDYIYSSSTATEDITIQKILVGLNYNF